MKNKIPAQCRQMEQSHFADICVFNVSFFTGASVASKAAKQRDKGKVCGKVKHNERDYYWCKVGFVNDESIYESEKTASKASSR